MGKGVGAMKQTMRATLEIGIEIIEWVKELRTTWTAPGELSRWERSRERNSVRQ